MQILINLIGGQTAPNYICADILKPDVCYNLFSKDSEKQKKYFEYAYGSCKHLGVEVDPFDYLKCFNLISGLISKHKNNELNLNFTGSTKIISNAAFNAFYQNDLCIYYIDSQHNKIIKFNKNGQTQEEINIKIPIDIYFKLYGQEIKPEGESAFYSSNSEENISKFEKFMEKYSEFVSKVFLSIARLDKKARENWRNEDHVNEKKLKQGNSFLNYKCENKEYHIHLEANSEILDIKLFGDDTFYFIIGRWMETLIMKKFHNAKYFDDVKANLKIVWDERFNRQQKNDLDISAMKNHTLHIYEIKSGGLNFEMFAKLRSIKELYGGSYSRINMVSYFDDDIAKARADELKINFIRLKDLDEHLANLKYKDNIANL